jgi:6-phosphogluconolactonase/glucosamine-6-phosphate isomerase/deaminase
MFMVTGGEKAAILKAVIEGPANGLPAALVRPAKGRLMFLADEDAGALLREDRRTGRK